VIYLCFMLKLYWFWLVNCSFPTEQDNIATLSPDTPALGRIQQAKVITSQEPRDAYDLRLSAGEVSSYIHIHILLLFIFIQWCGEHLFDKVICLWDFCNANVLMNLFLTNLFIIKYDNFKFKCLWWLTLA